jgi:3-deoxy-7-phosphoheptulonate synthase
MILHVSKEISDADLERLCEQSKSVSFPESDYVVLVSSSSVKKLPDNLDSDLEQHLLAQFVLDNDMQLSARQYQEHSSVFPIGKAEIGGALNNTLLIAGPCSVESEDQMHEVASFLRAQGIQAIRGGCYKPRTSPYSFQGLGLEGLKILAKIREQYDLPVVTEVRDATHIEEVIEYADVVQVGAKAMYDQGILRRLGRSDKPVLLKRGFGTNLQEFVQAAEFILSGGNPHVALCERGIRTFESKTRFTLDLCGVAWLQEYCNLPIILDPSHALGYRYGIKALARASAAMGIQGLLVESHPDPSVAKSDAAQQIDLPTLASLKREVAPVCEAVGFQLI